MPSFTVTSKFAPGDSVRDTVRDTDATVQFVTWALSNETPAPELTHRILFTDGGNRQHGRFADVPEDQLASL